MLLLVYLDSVSLLAFVKTLFISIVYFQYQVHDELKVIEINVRSLLKNRCSETVMKLVHPTGRSLECE